MATGGVERARKAIELTVEEAKRVRELKVNPHIPSREPSFYEDFTLRGIRLDRVEPGRVICSFRVPPRFTDRSGNLAPGAIANLVDELGAIVKHKETPPMDVSVNMSMSFMSTAKVDDELEITSSLRGELGHIYVTSVLITKKSTGEIVAEGQHSLFRKVLSSRL